MTETESVIRDYLVDSEGAPSDIGVDTPLIEEDILDSFGIFTLIDFIEQRFGAVVPEEQITLENFGTVGDIARTVSRSTTS